MNKWLKILLWCALFAGVIAILIWEQDKEANAKLSMPVIHISVEGKDTFLTKIEIVNRLQTQQIFNPQGFVSGLDISKVESILDTMQEIKDADVYKQLNGSWNIDLELVKPIARVFSRRTCVFLFRC